MLEKRNSVIITTSISGRGVDIQLGGKKGSIVEESQLQIDKRQNKISWWLICS